MKMLRLGIRRRSCEKKSAKPKHLHIIIRLMAIIDVPIIILTEYSPYDSQANYIMTYC